MTIQPPKSTQFAITRVVTKDFITDSFQGIRNIFGLRLRGYERMISKAIDEITLEAHSKGSVMWYRMSINPFGRQSCMITIYGEYNE